LANAVSLTALASAIASFSKSDFAICFSLNLFWK
jgi:hypothetical protein